MINRFLDHLNLFLLLILMLPFSILAQSKEDFKREYLVKAGDTLKYRILFPKGFSENKKYPVVLFLHGAGERGDDNESQLTHGSELFLNKREDFPVIVIFPQAPKEDYWAKVEVNRDTIPFKFNFKNDEESTKSLKLVIGLMENLLTKNFIDKDRIYVGGLSMGGMGTYEIIYKKPEMFTAAFVICGGANPIIAKAYPKGFNIWIFQGEKDDVVPPEYAKVMARAINTNGGNAKLSLYPNDNHNSWDTAFAEPELLPWLFNHTKNKK